MILFFPLTCHTPVRLLTLGLGNTLLTDDGVGVHVISALRRHRGPEACSLSMGDVGLPSDRLVANRSDCIIIDAAELGASPGALEVLSINDINAWLTSRQRTSVHEAGLAGLLSLLHLEERLPARLAIVAIQPFCADWGEELTPAVAAIVPKACATVMEIARKWGVYVQE